MKQFICLLIIFLHSVAAINASKKPQHIIFDFNGVLLGGNTHKNLQQVGFSSIIRYAACCKIFPTRIKDHIKNKLFETLEKTAQTYHYDEKSSIMTYDEYGTKLPYLMRAWLDGTITTQAIKENVRTAADKHPEWFLHHTEKTVILNIVDSIFTPEALIQTRTVHTNCVNFIKALKKHGHKIYALSNWDKESFPLLLKAYPDVFALFDGIVISGDVNTLKPSPDIYQLLLETYNLDASSCWFIDDQQENVEAAQKLGINGILCHQTASKKPDFKRVKQTIKTRVTHQRRQSRSETVHTASATMKA